MKWSNVLFSFTGRINRAKFWTGFLAAWIFVYVGVFIAFVVLDYGDAVWFFGMLALWTAFAVCTKRLHDMDKSAWWLFAVCLIPGLILALGLVEGTEGDNRFGADPLPPRTAFSYEP